VQNTDRAFSSTLSIVIASSVRDISMCTTHCPGVG
jgi:hypothetical protein